MIQTALKSKTTAVLIGDGVILSQSLLHKIVSDQEAEMEARAVKDVESGAVAQMMVEQGAGDIGDREPAKDKKEERRKKAAGGSAGGGAQGRQTKTKSTKKKGGKRRDDDDWSDDNDDVVKKSGSKASKSKQKELEFKSATQLQESLRSSNLLADFPEEMVEEVSEMLVDQLNRKYREVAREKYHSSLASSLQNKKRTHGDLTEKVNTVHTTIRLGEKAVAEFSKEEHRASVGKYLLKTHCTEIVNEMFQFVAEENMIKVIA